MNPPDRLSLVILISGRGSNLQALIDQTQCGELPATLCAVISDRPGAKGLERAAQAGIPHFIVDYKQFNDRKKFDAALQRRIDELHPDLIVLAGFMRILTPDFVRRYAGRMLNIHPSLLPAYRGLDTHARVLAAGDREHGASVHFVTAELDGGPVILQARVPVLADDDEARLAKRVLAQEHRIYPLAIRWLAEGRLQYNDGQLSMDGKPLRQPILHPSAMESATA